jgi:hypothetical protein
MSLLSALKLDRSQVSLWADLTYIMIGAVKIRLIFSRNPSPSMLQLSSKLQTRSGLNHM